eukprot:m.1527431 g.1527431  ORF g.1527431 m.1527431 type:complete len:93 (-) comp25234_c0_seq76:3433-3711(-)
MHTDTQVYSMWMPNDTADNCLVKSNIGQRMPFHHAPPGPNGRCKTRCPDRRYGLHRCHAMVVAGIRCAPWRWHRETHSLLFEYTQCNATDGT